MATTVSGVTNTAEVNASISQLSTQGELTTNLSVASDLTTSDSKISGTISLPKVTARLSAPSVKGKTSYLAGYIQNEVVTPPKIKANNTYKKGDGLKVDADGNFVWEEYPNNIKDQTITAPLLMSTNQYAKNKAPVADASGKFVWTDFPTVYHDVLYETSDIKVTG